MEISNDNFDAWISQDPGDNEYTTHLVFRTRNNNHLGEVISDKLRVTAGKWSVDVTVKQDNSAVYSGRFVNVLTVSSIGDLGVDMVSSDASGLAMRKVLDVNFAPAGTIRIGGFSYTRIPNTSGYVGTSNSDNLAVLKRIFGTQDVIYFPYDVNISSAVADLLLEWLDASPNRVLFMGMDTDATNKNLRLKPRIANEGTFGFSSISTVTTNYITASKSEAAKDFFEGPFGTVQEGAAINRADNIAGYIMNYSNDVIPLITSDKAGYEGYVFFSLNPANRIIYHGDAQLFQTSQMSNNNGNITSEADKLMANTWAWIIEQVIYGAD